MNNEAINVETIGETIAASEEESVRSSFKAKIAIYNEALKNKSIEKETLLEKILERYPALKTKQYGERIDGETLNNYERLNYPLQIRAGDVCVSGQYGVIVPKYQALNEISSLVNKTNPKPDLQYISKLVEAVHLTIEHAPRAFRKYDKSEMLTAGIIFKSYYQGKKMQLEDFLSGELPASCFEKAIALALLLSEDKGLDKFGIKTYLAVGARIFSGEYQSGHAWVRMEVPKGMEKFGLFEGAYALDPSDNKIYRLENAACAKLKYVPYPIPRDDFLYVTVYRPKTA